MPPTPSKASIIRFLRGCPMLAGLPDAALGPFAEHLTLRRHDDGARLLDDEVPTYGHSLYVVAHGRVTWEPRNTAEKLGGWTRTPGSILGLLAVADWARRAGLDPWWPRDPARVRCRAIGTAWSLELRVEHFGDVLGGEQGAALRNRLLSMAPTMVHAPEIIAVLRDTSQFGRVNSVALYRMLEYAPTVRLWAQTDPPGDEPKFELKKDGPEQDGPEQAGPEQAGPEQAEPKQADIGQILSHDRALYYVIQGQLRVDTDGRTEVLGPGSLGGADVFSSNQKGGSRPTAMLDTLAVQLDDHALDEMMRTNPGFGRSLGPLPGSAEAKS